MKPKAGDWIEIWSSNANLMGEGEYIDSPAENIVHFTNRWFNGDSHECTWVLEEPGLMWMEHPSDLHWAGIFKDEVPEPPLTP